MGGDEFPYMRERGRCDLCGAPVGEENLERVEVRRGRRGRTYGSPSTLARAIYVCARHPITPVDGEPGAKDAMVGRWGA
jgi:hypothetical protein